MTPSFRTRHPDPNLSIWPACIEAGRNKHTVMSVGKRKDLIHVAPAGGASQTFDSMGCRIGAGNRPISQQFHAQPPDSRQECSRAALRLVAEVKPTEVMQVRTGFNQITLAGGASEGAGHRCGRPAEVLPAAGRQTERSPQPHAHTCCCPPAAVIQLPQQHPGKLQGLLPFPFWTSPLDVSIRIHQYDPSLQILHPIVHSVLSQQDSMDFDHLSSRSVEAFNSSMPGEITSLYCRQRCFS